MDEALEQSFVPFSTQSWWLEFITAVQENQNALSYLPESSSVSPPKTLYWALNAAVEILDVSEVGRKEIILDYVTGRGGGIFKFIELLVHLGTSIPVGIKISALIREFVNPRNGVYKQAALRQLITLEPAQILFHFLEEINKEKGKTADKETMALLQAINVNAIWITSAVAKKDPNFATYAREMNKVKFVHDFVKKNFFHPRNEVHYPCLKILRVLAKDPKARHLLGRDKFFHTLKKIMELYVASPSTKFQMALDILVMLTRNSKSQCKRFLKAGGLVTVMRVFSFWPLWRGRGLTKMTKCVLNVYLQLSTTYSGRRALIQSEALHSIRQFCEGCPKDKHFDDVIMRAYAVNSLTYGKHKLPFKHLDSPAKFEFVGRQGKGARDSGTSSDEDDPDDIDENHQSKPRSRDDDDDDDDADSEIIISDIELEDSNAGSEDDDVTLKDDAKPSKSKARSRNGKLDLPSTSAPPYDSRKGLAHGRPFPYSSNPMPYEATDAVGDYLYNYASFFKEMDSSPNAPIPHFNPETYESIVVGLLGNFISMELHGAPCPMSEHKPDIPSHKYYYSGGSMIPMHELRKTYLVVSNQIRSVIPFVKVAYPEVTMGYGGKRMEYTSAYTDRFVLRDKMVQLMQRTAGIGQMIKPVVVYDLDSLLHNHPVDSKQSHKKTKPPSAGKVPKVFLGNDDELKVGKFDKKKKHSLKFESRFEGGNLRKAIQVAECEYDLYLMSDVNSNRHNQWFYFQVSNTPEDTPITFNIVNCIKTNSQFNYGMQPVVFSVMEAMDMRPGWVRAGSNVMYYRNGYQNSFGKKRRFYYSATFTLTFTNKGDICYIAYHYPYSYSRLLTELWRMTKLASEEGRIWVRYDMLCHSENDNEVPLMTVTALNDPRNPIELREIIFLSSRVHPGEPNSSWVMHGILHQLLFGPGMDEVLKRYVFKVLPMLNVEGVINGCGRCGLTDEDLNRCWKDPDPNLHPSIFHSKALIEYSCKIRNKVPTLYCDLHGHSRRKNVFFYGCSTSKSWCMEDRMKPEESPDIQALPDAMSRRSPAFQISYCKYDVRKQRESTARVALWREFGITRSYTLESSYCGCDRGAYKGMSIGIGQLIEVGEALCEACVELYDPPVASVSMFDIPTEWDPDLENTSKNNLIRFAEVRYTSPSPSPEEPKARSKAKKTRSNRVRTAQLKKGPNGTKKR